MASLIPGYEYDIFISYRQKDNKRDGWVTEFVDNLNGELESTFKEEITVYFDINPHDGLLETHDVDASLKEKLKCLVFIPIISRTYCDPKSFAWEHEFKAFIELTSQDHFGLKVKLPNGNVANRVLPVRIHDLDIADIKECELVLGGALRGVEFIYKESGFNRPLKPDDDEKINSNKTKYRNQITKVTIAIKEIIEGLKALPVVAVKESAKFKKPLEQVYEDDKQLEKEKAAKLNTRKLLSGVTIIAILIVAALLAYPKLFKRNTLEKLRSSGERIAVAVMPFQNMTYEDAKKWYLQAYEKENLMSKGQKLEVDVLHAILFGTLYDQIKCLRQQQDFDDENPVVYNDLGATYSNLHQYDKAIPEFKKSLDIYNKWGVKPFWFYNYTGLGWAYYKTGQLKKAKEIYKKEEQDFPSIYQYLNWQQAILALSEGDTIAANHYIEQRRSLTKENSWSDARFIRSLGFIYSEAGILDKAEKFYRQSLAMEPENALTLDKFTSFLIDNDRNINEGLELIDKALNLDPDNYNYLDTKGWGLYKQGKYKVALEIL